MVVEEQLFEVVIANEMKKLHLELWNLTASHSCCISRALYHFYKCVALI